MWDRFMAASITMHVISQMVIACVTTCTCNRIGGSYRQNMFFDYSIITLMM
jgi:hypothetical protein